MTTKAKGSSVRQKLTDLSKELKVIYQNLETAFLIERIVARLVADKNLSQHLVFKGGFVGLRVYDSHRYTVDLDALLVKANIESALVLAKEKIEADLDDGVWFRFEDQVDLATQGEYGGIRQVYRTGIGDPITPGPKKLETPSLLSPIKDISWSVYPIETIIAEKLHALVTHGNINSRSKDVYDLSVFLPKTDAVTLGKALRRCFVFRKTKLPERFSEAITSINTIVLERGWLSATVTVPEEPQFKEAFHSVIQHIGKLEKEF